MDLDMKLILEMMAEVVYNKQKKKKILDLA